MVSLYSLTVERVASPLAAPTSRLRFGWKLKSGENNVTQTAYSLVITHREQTVFDSGTVQSAESVDVIPDIKLIPGADYDYTVTSYTTAGNASENGKFSTAPELNQSFIRHPKHKEGACVYFRREFSLSKKPVRAMLYLAGLGYGTLYLNGSRVDGIYFDAPYSNYEKEVLYRAYEVTDLLDDNNCVGVHCGEGFYSQSRVWAIKAFKYGNICCFAQINIEYDDGTAESIVTDGSWQTMYSPTILSNIHGGELRDGRLYDENWCRVGYNDIDLVPAVPDSVQKGALKPALMPPCRVIRRIKPIAVKQITGQDSGVWVYDMGENFAGTVTLRPPFGSEGATYILRFAEAVDEKGQCDYRSTGVYHVYCQQQQIYIAAGKQGEQWTPEFSYHSFRYVEMTGFFGRDPGLDLLEGLAISTDFQTYGQISTSSKDINELQTIMMRTIRSNYHGFPEDCPAREKCGWLGDAEVVCDTAIYNYDMAASYEKYLSDIRTSRLVYGDWTMIAPGKRTCGWASPLWGCAQIVIPYKLWLYCRDRYVLEEYYPDMCKWIEHELNRSEGFIIKEGLGDWCPPSGNCGKRRIPVTQSSTLMFYEETVMLASISRELGYDAEKYEKLANDIKNAFNTAFYDSEKHTYGYQATNGVCWLLHIVPGCDRDALVNATHDMIVSDSYNMTTGIYGNKYLIPMLFEAGLGDDAMKIMFGRDHIDFGTMMDDGATSLWECLEMKNVGMPAEGFVCSFNHPMHSGFAYFYYAQLAGIKPLKPGFAEFSLSPCLDGAPDEVNASYETPYGLIKSERHGKTLKFTVPVNTVCTLKVCGKETRYGSGEYTVALI